MVENQDQSDELDYGLSNRIIEEALLLDENAGFLEDYFGAEEYQVLKELSQKAAATTQDGPRVLILPGTMGSQLSKIEPGGDCASGRIIWMGFSAIRNGEITKLKLPPDHGDDINVCGVVPVLYFQIRLALRADGFNADFYPFDWRRGIDALGKELDEHLGEETASNISLVCHSYGGMIARAALKRANSSKVERLIMLGTPNFGSFISVRGIRGTSEAIKNIAWLDKEHSAEDIARQLIGTLPGIYDTLPAQEKFDRVDLYKREEWPNQGPLPSQELLDGVGPARESMADADDRFFLIAGVGQKTFTDLKMEDGQFVYTQTSSGDGTVPVEFAKLPDAKTYYVEAEHTRLPSTKSVITAVTDILKTGSTTALPDHWSPPPQAAVQNVSESMLRAPSEERPGTELSDSELREIAEALVLQREIVD